MKGRSSGMRNRKPTDATPASVSIHIEELVLDGFAHGDRYYIGEALQSELARLLEKRGISLGQQHNTEVEEVTTGPVRIAPGSKPEFIGSKLGQAVYGGIGKLSTSGGRP